MDIPIITLSCPFGVAPEALLRDHHAAISFVVAAVAQVLVGFGRSEFFKLPIPCVEHQGAFMCQQ